MGMPGDQVERNAAIIRERRGGASIGELAARYGLSASWVYQLIRRHGGSKRLDEAVERETAVRRELLREFAMEYGRSPSSVEEFTAWRVMRWRLEMRVRDEAG